MKITEISEAGLELIKKYEGFRSKPYLCPANVPTIGYGTTIYPNGEKVKLSDPPIDEEKATLFLKENLKTYEKAVDSFTRHDISQNQFDALVSFAYNLGVAALKQSTLLKKVNTDPNDKSIAVEFDKWSFAAGKKLPGLLKRREEEASLYLS